MNVLIRQRISHRINTIAFQEFVPLPPQKGSGGEGGWKVDGSVMLVGFVGFTAYQPLLGYFMPKSFVFHLFLTQKQERLKKKKDLITLNK